MYSICRRFDPDPGGPRGGEENKIGDVVGHTYYTDIAARINGIPCAPTTSAERPLW